jgi:YidC/Oxa1 family membrane protein insertase
MERRLLIVFALTFLVIMLFQPLLKKYGPQPPAKTDTAAEHSAGQPAAAVSTQSLAQQRTPDFVAQGIKVGRESAPRQATSESETVIENDVYRIVFTNRGARVKSWVLKKYTDDKGGQLELVNATAAEKYGYPLTLWTYDEELRNKLNSALYVGSHFATRTDTAGASPLGASYTAPTEVVFGYSDGDLSIRKTYTFDSNSYVVGVKTDVIQKGTPVTAFPMWPAGFGADMTGAQYALGQIVYQYDDKVERLAIKKISGGGTLQGPFNWAGVSDQYFAAAFMPQDPRNVALVTLRNPVEIPHGGSDTKQMDKIDVLGAAVGTLGGPSNVRLYVGPKALADLQSVSVPGITGAEPDLRAVIDFGWLGIIARPLFLWLKWMHVYVKNWGWAILLQTLIINLALLPLRLSQMKSMLKMQRVAPQIKSIQEKYKKYSLRDPKKAEMNEEISALYKKEGVNPAGGCLPLLIQMPFLFAYYRMLNVAMDLRHAPWLWIHDLSAPDPLHILPIAIIITMFAMQRMTPQAGMDPAQQKMMNIMMPGMLGLMSWNLPAGLGLYWSAGQLIGIVQQSVMNRTSLGREMREMMEKRARKKEK